MTRYSVCADGIQGYGSGCVNVSGGLIESLTPEPEHGAVYDYRGLRSLVLPGLIDLHVHLRGLGLSYKEDESSGTAAAASGCISLVVDMPNTEPYVRDPYTVKLKLSRLAALSHVDYGLYSGIPDEPGDAWEIAWMPVAGFKVYPWDLASRERSICEALKASEEAGKVVVIHPEAPEYALAEHGWDRWVHRPCWQESLSLEYLQGLRAGCGSPRIHVTHASCASTVSRARSLGFTVDVTPHHLFYHHGSLRGLWGGCEAKVNPPLRGAEEPARLLQLLLEGLIDAVASDHAPHSLEEKAFMHPQICPPGLSGLEHWAGFTLARLYYAGRPWLLGGLASSGPAGILGLAPPRISPGSPATLSVFSLSWVEAGCPGASKARATPYFGERAARCLALFVRGSPVYIGGSILVGEGFGVNAFEALD